MKVKDLSIRGFHNACKKEEGGEEIEPQQRKVYAE
jgi:hypothetical protein